MSFAIKQHSLHIWELFSTPSQKKTNGALNKTSDADIVYYSELNEWFTRNAFRSFSLKYVIDRCIWYKVGNKEHAVPGGNFLLACKQPGVNAYFDSKAKL